MHRIYRHNNDHIEVFTTVLAPQVRYQYQAQAEKMVVTRSYKPHWPDEVALARGDVILVLSKHEEERWFGRLQNGQRGYFPASCVMELSQENAAGKDLGRTLSLRSSIWDNVLGFRGRCGRGHGLQSPTRGSTREGGGGGGTAVSPEVSPAGRVGPFLVMKPQISLTLPSKPELPRSLGLLHRILSKRCKKTEYQGATNGAFEAD